MKPLFVPIGAGLILSSAAALAAPVTQPDVDALVAQVSQVAGGALAQAVAAQAQRDAIQLQLDGKSVELAEALKADATNVAHIAILQGDVNNLTTERDKLIAAMPAPTITSVTAVPDTIDVGDKSRVTVVGTRIATCSPAMEFDVRPDVSTDVTVDCLGLDAKTHVTGSARVTVKKPAPPASTVGLLSRSLANPRYFAGPDGTPVYLTGSHHWLNLQDGDSKFPPTAFNYTAYLDWMKSNNFNFIRLWSGGEHPYRAPWQTTGGWYNDPVPFPRTGPGNAADGKPKFDLTKLNQAYFDRMRDRVIKAGQKGIYVGVMLFQGWSLDGKGSGPNPWPYHPYNVNNNINNVNGDPANTGKGLAIQTLGASVAALAAQQAYVRKVVDTVGDLDNVLYEISNESDGGSMQWQNSMIDFIKSYEAGKPKRHPVGLTVPFPGGNNGTLFSSSADWVSPNPGLGYTDNPPANDGSKVILSDTDHLWGVGGNDIWAWKSFTRGLNPIFMDDLGQTGVNPVPLGGIPPANPAIYTARVGMTQTARYAAKLDLRTTMPSGSLSSTGYMLAKPGAQYLAFAPNGGGFTVNLSAGPSTSFSAEWLNVTSGNVVNGDLVSGGSSQQAFTPPFAGPAALLLTTTGTTPPPPPPPPPPVAETTPTNTTIGSGTDSLVLQIGQDQYLGSATYTIKVDGVQIGGVLTAHALHSNPTKDVTTVKGEWATGTHTVDVQMLEDAWGGDATKDRNLYVEGAMYNGATVSGASLYLNTAAPKRFTFVDGTATPPPPPPPPPSSLPPGNSLRLNNKSGITATNYTLQIGRPFICGEIAHNPQVIVNGVPTLTQVEVKNRCLDGSVKYAVTFTIVPLPGDGSNVDLTFQDQATGNTAAVTAAELLAQFPDFDAGIELTKPATMTGTFEPDIAKWKAVKDAALSLVVDGKTYAIGPIDLSTQPTLSYVNSWFSSLLRDANVPVTLGMSSSQVFMAGGKTLALGVPTTGTDIGPLFFKSNVVNAVPSAPVSVSARKMLEDGNCKPWTSGPVEVVLQCYDRSTARVYDLGPGGSTWRSFHPEFELSFWLPTKQVSIRYVGEVTNAMALEAFTADVKLTSGKASPATVFQQNAVPHSLSTRWTKTAWVGGTPEPKVNIDHNIGYLADTGFIWNFDRSLKIPESVIASSYAVWLGRPHTKILDKGEWLKTMPDVGYHPDIGPMPLWYNQAVYTGDWRMREFMLGQADLAGAWTRMHTREGDSNRFANRAKTIPALGLPVIQYARPYQDSAADRIVPRSPGDIGGYNQDIYNGSGWVADTSHQPDPFTVPYMLTGDPFYLEGLQLWAAADTKDASGPYIVCMQGGQTRAMGWVIRTIGFAWAMSPDNDPMRSVFYDALSDIFAAWEGQRGIKGTKYEGTVPWKTWFDKIRIDDPWLKLGPSPLHFWNYTGTPTAHVALNPLVTERPGTPWQMGFLAGALGHIVDLGFTDAQPIFSWFGENMIGQCTDPAYNCGLAGMYLMPFTAKDANGNPRHFTSWAEVRTGWSALYQNAPDSNDTEWSYWPGAGAELYWDVARWGFAVMGRLPKGLEAWINYNAVVAKEIIRTGQTPNRNFDPTWSALPRTAPIVH